MSRSTGLQHVTMQSIQSSILGDFYMPQSVHPLWQLHTPDVHPSEIHWHAPHTIL